jgi:hypothetical protein
MKTKLVFLVVFGGFLAAALFLGCKNEATHIIIDKGERIPAPSNLEPYGHEQSYSSSVSIDFTSSPEALYTKVYVASSDDKRGYYEITSSGSSNSFSSSRVTISKNLLPGFYNYGSSGNPSWSLSGSCYIGIASINHAGVYSDIAWTGNLYSYSSYPGGGIPNPPSGGTITAVDLAGNWSFTGYSGGGVSTISFTVYLNANSNSSGTWTMSYYSGGYTDSGTFTLNGNSGTLYTSSGNTPIGSATITNSSTMTLVLNNYSNMPGTYYGTKDYY